MGRLALVVEKKIQETADTYSLRFKFPEGLKAFPYEPGQFVHVHGVVNGEKVERSYSVSSAPGVDPFFQLTVKRIEGGKLSPFIVERLLEGDVLELSEPQGRFFEEARSERSHYILVGAGSGVTPLFSMLKWLLASHADHKVSLVYASRSEAGVIFREALDELAKAHPDRLQVIHILTRPSDAWKGETGRLDKDRLLSLLTAYLPCRDLDEIAYLCGPESFMAAAAEALSLRGLRAADIRRESFDVADPVTATDLDEASTCRVVPEGQSELESAAASPCSSLIVRIDGDDAEIHLEPGETVLAAILRTGLDAPFSCQEGTCLSCMCRVEKGAVRMKRHDLIGLTPDDLGAGIVLACLCRPDASEVRLSFENV